MDRLKIAIKKFCIKNALPLVLCMASALLAFCSHRNLNANPEAGLQVSIIGDVMCHDPQLASAWNAKTKSYDFETVFADIKPWLSKADLTIANLETTLPGKRKLYSGYPTFGSPDALAVALKKSGVDVLTLANNHSVDKGKAGILRTIEVTRKLGFATLGTYKNAKDYRRRRVLLLQKKGIKLALLNYTYGTNEIPVPKGVYVNRIRARLIRKDLQLARSYKPDAIMVLYHFGTEYKRTPDAFQKKWVRFAIQNGADIVIGGHPHVVQAFGVRKAKDALGQSKERLIAWSLGNFVSNQQRRYTDGGIIFHFRLTRNPDPKSPQKILFWDISYTPVWVYVERKKKRRIFRVLPVELYMDPGLNPPRILPKRSWKMMKVFYDDLAKHLSASQAAVAKYRSFGSSGKIGAERTTATEF